MKKSVINQAMAIVLLATSVNAMAADATASSNTAEFQLKVEFVPIESCTLTPPTNTVINFGSDKFETLSVDDELTSTATVVIKCSLDTDFNVLFKSENGSNVLVHPNNTQGRPLELLYSINLEQAGEGLTNNGGKFISRGTDLPVNYDVIFKISRIPANLVKGTYTDNVTMTVEL